MNEEFILVKISAKGVENATIHYKPEDKKSLKVAVKLYKKVYPDLIRLGLHLKGLTPHPIDVDAVRARIDQEFKSFKKGEGRKA